MNAKVLFAFILFCKSILASATGYYVSPSATSSGNGSFANPWTLQTAFDHPASLMPGDTVWMKGGTYTHTALYDPSFGYMSYNCKTNGTANAPIIFRNYKNQRATIDAETNQVAIFVSNCSYTWFWGIEVMSSSTARNANRAYIYCTAKNMKFINMNLHDLYDGIDLWNAAKNAELYGCIIYHNGFDQLNPDLAHGHGIYTQNDTTNTRVIENNIFFSSFAYNVKLWSTNQGIDNYNIYGNIVFNGGAASQFNDSRKANFFIVSNNPARPIRNLDMRHNYTYAGNINAIKGLCNVLGDGEIIDASVDSNYFLGQLRALGPYTNMVAVDNTIYGGTALNYTNNQALFDSTFTNSTQSQNIPTSGLEYFVMPNKYEIGRANVAIYNWANINTVQINISGIGLNPGDLYELVNVMDYYNDISIGTFPSGGLITVPMTGHTFVQATISAIAPVSQFPTFGAFLIRKADNQTAAAKIQLIEGTTSIVNGGAYDFGTTPVGINMIRTFTIKNSGVLPLTLGTLSALPVGFSLVGQFPSASIPAGDTASFHIMMDASIVSNPSGLISFATNDPNGNPFHFTISGISSIPGYCEVSVAQPQFIWIAGVTLDTMSKTSVGSAYSDFTSTSFDVMGGLTIPIILNPGYNSANVNQQYDVNWAIWCDFNNDLDFNDPGENVLTAMGDTHYPLDTTLAFPNTTVNTRMRISMCLDGFGEQPLNCGMITYGEVEDYTLNVTSVSTAVNHLPDRIHTEVYPNPFTNQCVLSLGGGTTGRYKVVLINVFGELVQSTFFENHLAVIKRDSLPTGLYTFIVLDELGNFISNGKLVVL